LSPQRNSEIIYLKSMNLKEQLYLIDEHQFKINALKPVHPELWAIIQIIIILNR
jgi:hypothetical protein